jgi:hypothetical protein
MAPLDDLLSRYIDLYLNPQETDIVARKDSNIILYIVLSTSTGGRGGVEIEINVST